MTKTARSPVSWTDCITLTEPQALEIVLDAFRRFRACKGTRQAINPLETCELLELDRHTPTRTYVNALALCLTEAIGNTPQLNPPGCVVYSFDEVWLLRLLERSHMRDDESVAFLISSRIPHQYRNAIAFLVNGLVVRIEKMSLEDGIA